MAKLKWSFLMPCFFLLVVRLYPDTELFKLLEECSSGLKWEPLRQLGVIEKDRVSMVFRPGMEWVILNYSEKLPIGDIQYRDGNIIFSDPAAQIVRTYFGKKYSPDKPRIAAVLIDPGHGGRDSGTIGTHTWNGATFSLKEKDINLSVSKVLYSRLRKSFPDKTILMTRNDDSYPSLEERVEIANNVKLNEYEAIIFVSIHTNASLNPKAKGFEVWYLTPEYRRKLIDEDSVKSESREVIPILNTMLEEEYTLESILLAQRILDGLNEQVGNLTEKRSIKEESWFVVRNAKMPSILVELGFITNLEEALMLKEDDYLKKLAEGIYNGISRFIAYFEHIN
ncbi:MAG: N-acetylmuramoyl-L-alanine amidase [Spirochaetota bacterium]